MLKKAVPYEEMYHLLCSAISDGLDAIEGCRLRQAVDGLRSALLHAENMYLSADDEKRRPCAKGTVWH